MSTFEAALPRLRAVEGLHADDPDDPGGDTWYGLSRRAYPNEEPWPPTRARAEAVFRATYWDALRLSEVDDQRVASKVFDMAVNMGPGQAARLLQRAVNYLVRRPREVEVDGDVGPQTLAAANASDPELLYLALCAYHARHYVDLVEGPDARYETFAKGWLRRALT